ncbi:MAG: hypothetical protein ACI86H_001412 [bacterium]|jgi:hypothetical protein
MRHFSKIFVFFLLFMIPALSLIAGINDKRIIFDQDLSIVVYHNYPTKYDSYSNTVTTKIKVENKGIKRRLMIHVTGSADLKKEIRVPSKETQSFFFHIPTSTSYANPRLNIIDLDTGVSKQVWVRVYRKYKRFLYAKLGHISTNIHVPRSKWQDFGVINTKDLPNQWHAIAGINVLVTQANILEGNHLWKKTILDWISMGGRLYVLTPSKNSSKFTPEKIFNKIPFLPKKQTGRFSPFRETKRFPIGNGELIITDSTYPIKEDLKYPYRRGMTAKKPLSTSIYRLRRYVKKVLVEVGEPPAVLLFVLLTIFAVLVGPVAWRIFVKKKNQPFRYIGIVISSSLLVSCAIFLVDLLAEGITPKVLVHSLQVVDLKSETEIRSDLNFIYRTSSLSGAEIRVPNQSVYVNYLSRSRSNQGALSIKTDPVWKWLTGSIPVRQRTLIGTHSIHTLKRKLVITKEGNSLVVENHLGRDLKKLVIHHDWEVFSFKNLKKGTRAKAEKETVRRGRDSRLSQHFFLGSKNKSQQLSHTSHQLAKKIVHGNMGSRYFYGQFDSIDKENFILSQSYRELDEGKYEIVGVY